MKNLLIILALGLVSISIKAAGWPKDLGELNSPALYTVHLLTDIQNYHFIGFQKTIDDKGVLTYRAKIENPNCAQADNAYVQLYITGSKINFTNTFMTKACL